MAGKFSAIKLPTLPFIKPKESFAVDIGNSSIKILQLKQSGSRYSLVKWGVLPVNEKLMDIPPEERRRNIISKTAEFLAAEKILIKNAVTSISGHQVIVRYVKFPKLSREELSKTISFEAEPYIPFDIREVELSFHVLQDVTEDGQKKMETILVASKKDIIQSRLDIFNELNLRLIIIDVDTFAIENAYELNAAPDDAGTVMIVNVGSSVTNIAIMENKVSKVVRDIFISGDTFTKVIQRNLGCDLKQAEDLKAQHSLLVTAADKEKTLAENQKEALQVSQALTSVAKDLLTEIHRSIDFYISQNPDKTIGKILLCGGTSVLKNLDVYLSQDLKTPVEIFNPLKNVVGGETVPADIAPQFAVAVGLAMRRENDLDA